MDAEYICPKLKELALLLHGKDCKPFAKEKNKMYIFGSKKYNIKNKVSKAVAIYLAMGVLTNKKSTRDTN